MVVSVAIATYNGEQYIIEQLESIKKQTRRIDEVIISDDGSTDNTVNYVQEYIAKNNLHDSWKLLINENKGIFNNFYNAISNTNGDLIFLCDQDDIWDLNKISIVEDIFLRNTNIHCVNTSFEYYDGKQCFTRDIVNCSNNGLIPFDVSDGDIVRIPIDTILKKNISPGMTMAFDSVIKERYVNYSHKKIIHDYEINCMSCIDDSLFFYNKPLVKYRIHNNQTLSIRNIKKERLWNKIKDKIKRNIYEIKVKGVLFEELENIPQNLHISEIKRCQRLFDLKKEYLLTANKNSLAQLTKLENSVDLFLDILSRCLVKKEKTHESLDAK